jgi:hypothetical protein
LEAIETSFHQDLNGDGTIGIAPGSGSIASAQPSVQSSSDEHNLVTASPSTFGAQIIGFRTESTDKINLAGINFALFHVGADTTPDTLTAGDGSTSAQFKFLRTYTQDGFHFTGDDHIGTVMPAAPGLPAATQTPASSSSQTGPICGSTHDTFVFATNFGQVSIDSPIPSAESNTFSKSAFASQAGLTAVIHADTDGNVAIIHAAHDTITVQQIATADLLTHLTDFHLI